MSDTEKREPLITVGDLILMSVIGVGGTLGYVLVKAPIQGMRLLLRGAFIAARHPRVAFYATRIAVRRYRQIKRDTAAEPPPKMYSGQSYPHDPATCDGCIDAAHKERWREHVGEATADCSCELCERAALEGWTREPTEAERDETRAWAEFRAERP